VDWAERYRERKELDDSNAKQLETHTASEMIEEAERHLKIWNTEVLDHDELFGHQKKVIK
jgi:chromatin segregation and condensation protein Rec8/ScpA/Scc1 (kleisin family)